MAARQGWHSWASGGAVHKIDRKRAASAPMILMAVSKFPEGQRLRQFGQERGGILNVGVAESLSKPPVNWRE